MKFLNLTYVILCISVSFDLVSQSISDEDVQLEKSVQTLKKV